MDNFKEAKKVGLIGIIGNIFLLVIKFTVSFLSKSQGMLADSLNSLIDIFSSFMTYLGSKISSKPKDENHAFGHEKAEYIFSLIISLFMMLISINVFKGALISLINRDKFIFSYKLIFICIVTILIKLCLYLYTKKVYKKTSNIIIKANMEDHKNDILLTSSTAIGIIMGKFDIYFLDSIIGMIIPIFIVVNAVKLAIESSKVLMDQNLSREELESISEIALSNDKVLHIDSIAAKPMGSKFLIILKLSMDGNITLYESHKESGKIKEEIMKYNSLVSDVVIHTNPE